MVLSLYLISKNFVFPEVCAAVRRASDTNEKKQD